MKLESLALHHGYDSEPTTKSAAVPIYQTSSYTFDNTQHGADLFDLKVPGNIYTRIMNPTTDVLEQRLAAMEGGIASLAVASGMSAITYAIQCICEVGDNIVSTSQLYGGTYNLFAHSLPKQGIEVRLLSHDDFDGFEKAIDSKTKAIFCESIGNPAGNIVDIEKLAEIAHRHGVPVIVDNTVATPYLCQAFEKGADIVIHSLTKYIGGHGTSIGGVIIDSGKFDWVVNKERFPVLNEPDPSYHGVIYTEALGPAAFIGRCRVVPLRNTGAAISPMNSFQILQGLETLGLRMERHCDNAEKLAQYLNTHEKVAWVNYATLPDSPYKAMSEKITGDVSNNLNIDFIITKDKRYCGVGKVSTLLKILTDAQIQRARHSNPLTLLPGNVLIHNHVESLISQQQDFHLAYFDINYFKPFNDYFGYNAGDEVIKLLSAILIEHSAPVFDMVGHIGGDDFIVVYRSNDWQRKCEFILEHFKAMTLKFYSKEEVLQQGVWCKNRRGDQDFFSLLSLAIGVVNPETSISMTYHEVSELATNAKKQAKLKAGNHLFISRRRSHYKNTSSTSAIK